MNETSELRLAALEHAIKCYRGPDDDTIPVLRHWLRDLRAALSGDPGPEDTSSEKEHR